MAGPGIPSGLRTQTMVGLYDIMPTLMDLCALDIPDDLDGVSLTPFFNGHADFVPHNSIVTEYVAVTAVDRGNYRKSSGRPFPSFRAIITKRYKYSEPYESDGFNPTLFDLERDPDELVNRYHDPAYADVVQTLSAQLNQEHTTDEWAAIAAEDYARAQRECRDYIKPSMPNQYMLKDGRIFDAEKSLYDVRWLQTSNDSIYAGYIPQRLH